MDIFTPDRLLTIAAFLGVLLLLWVGVRQHGARFSERLKQGKRLEIAEVAALGSATRAVLLTVDGTRVLVVSGRKPGTASQPLPGGANTRAAEDPS